MTADTPAPTPQELEWLIIKQRCQSELTDSLLEAMFSSLDDPRAVFQAFCKSVKMQHDLMLDTNLSDEELNVSRALFEDYVKRISLIVAKKEMRTGKSRGKRVAK